MSEIQRISRLEGIMYLKGVLARLAQLGIKHEILEDRVVIHIPRYKPVDFNKDFGRKTQDIPF